MWHPVKKELWAFDPAAQTIWRVNADGTGALLFAKDKVAVPASVNLRYTHRVAFYWDAARKAPVYLFATYTEIALGVLRGAAFAPVAQKNVLEVPPSSADAFVFDSRRNVLVHFVSTHDSSVKEGNIRKARGGLTVRELGVDGAWRDVGKHSPM